MTTKSCQMGAAMFGVRLVQCPCYLVRFSDQTYRCAYEVYRSVSKAHRVTTCRRAHMNIIEAPLKAHRKRDAYEAHKSAPTQKKKRL